MKSTPNIQTLLTQAPYVTIQQLFQQNSLEEIANVHKFLQDNIRTQGIGLKKIFESKYMDLVNCSQLLEKVNSFALKIDGLAAQIKGTIKVDKEQDSSIKKGQDKIVQKVESLVRKNRFTQAIRQCLADKHKQPILFEVVLLQTIEAIMHKTLSKNTEQGLFDILQALTLFLHYEGANYLNQQNVQQQYGSSLSILSKHFKRMNKKSTRSYLLASINSLFQIKIKQSCIDKNNTQFSSFVQDLLSMISLIQSGFQKINIKIQNVKDEGQQLSLTDIQDSYKNNFERIKNSLSKQMISSKDKRIYFNFDFYNAMLADNHLLEKFELLQTKLSSTNTISQVLGRLWSDFYHQFVEYVLKELNTFQWVYHQVSGLVQQQLVFPEFKRHLKDNFAVNMLAQGRKYKQAARLLLSQISQLIKLCSQQDGEALLNHFRTQMKIYLEKNADHFVQLFQSLSDNNQRLKTCMVTLVFQTYFIGNVLHLDSHEIMRSIIEDSQVKIEEALKPVLIQYAQNIPFHENIERMFQDLEQVCMPLVVYLKQKQQKQSFKIFILWLLESIQTTLEGKNLEKVSYTISYLQKSNTISQHEPLFHFIPSILFNITNQSQNRPFNVDYYQNLLQAQQSNRIAISDRRDNFPTRSNRDLFDIGEKDPSPSSTTVTKKTSQLMALSSQFVGGLINRIRQ